MTDLDKFHSATTHKEDDFCDYCLKFFQDTKEVIEAISSLLRSDPRSVYRKTKCSDKLYYFTIDSIHVTCWFDIDSNCAEVLKLKPSKHANKNDLV